MIIKVKMMDENLQPKGKDYTYKSEVNVEVGDYVEADFGGVIRVLVVTETGIDPKEIEGLPYEIKTIKGIAENVELLEGSTLDIKIEEEALPVIRINFDKIKAALLATLENYRGIVVTESTLSGCKSTQKELASLRIKIDNYRKDKKKELSKPIEFFENQCKELIALIEQAEQPIKEGIKSFDDLERAEKRVTAENLIREVVEKTGLKSKYGAQLTVIDKYCNLTAKESDIRADLESRALALLSEQNREEELTDIIKDSIETANLRINTKMKLEDFQRLIDRNVPTKDILAEVTARAESIYQAEHPAPKPEPVPVAEPAVVSNTPLVDILPVASLETPPQRYAVYRITGSAQQLLNVSKFLKDNGITYEVTEQDEV